MVEVLDLSVIEYAHEHLLCIMKNRLLIVDEGVFVGQKSELVCGALGVLVAYAWTVDNRGNVATGVVEVDVDVPP